MSAKNLCISGLLSSWFSVITALFITATSAIGSDATSSDIAPLGQSGDVFAKVEALVKEYYPKAKITKSDKSMHFETKVKSEEGYYSHKLESAPMSGGIRGDVSVEPGEYKGTYKDKLACELNEGFFRVLVLAPHCQSPDSHLLAILAFPADVPIDFKSGFRTIVSSFGASTQKANEQTSSSAPTNIVKEKSESASETNSSPTAIATSSMPAPTLEKSTPPPVTEQALYSKAGESGHISPLIKNARQVFDRFTALDLASDPRIIELYSNDAKIYLGIIDPTGQTAWRTLDKQTYGTFTASAYQAGAKLNAQTRYDEPKFAVDKRGGVMVSFSARMPGSATSVQWVVRPNKAKVWQIVDERSVSRQTR